MKAVLQIANITAAFKAIASGSGDRVAVSWPQGDLSYSDLDRRSDHLASRLIARGVQPGALIGLGCEKSPLTIIAMLGILKAGAGYVPLPEHYPPDRLAQILSDAGIGLILADRPAAQAGAGVQMLPIAAVLAEDHRSVTPHADPAADAVAYVMFTSGSTGQPKGVMVPHRAVLRLVRGQDFMALGPDERILQNAPMAFDAATLEIWGALLNGGTLVLAPQDKLSLRRLGETLRDQRITSIWLTAGLFHAMADERPQDFAPLRQLLTGGDVVSPAKVARVRAVCPDLVVINGYGPTENTTFTCCHTITPADLATGLAPSLAPSPALPIGRAIHGTQIFVTDAALNPVPAGTEGELCAAGDGLALGYLGRPDLTAEKFVDAPWQPGLRLYRTGDLVRQDANGVVQFLGRIDTQVKLRGYRVELSEVEAAMEAVPGVRDAVAVVRAGSDAADRMLVGYYIPGPGFDAAAMTATLASRLPDYAIPARLVALETLPLNENGKVDRRALSTRELAARPLEPQRATPAPPAGPQTGPQTGPDTAGLEDRMTRHLAEILALTDPDRQANFFDLGASSLHLARLHERMEQDLGRAFPITDFFLHSSIAAMARHLSGKTEPRAEFARTPGDRGTGTDLIAIVGMAGRFPGARDVDTLWQGLLEGREMISHFTPQELDYTPPDLNSPEPYVLARGVMEAPADFDARHFGIPPREAERMDPQHRILLEVAQTALENAGHDPERFAGRIGIFAGSSQNSYLLNNLVSGPGAARALAAGYPVRDFATLFGNDKDFIATRIAYKLNLRGPAVTVQCACSTSLVAVAQACDALRSGLADMALAGGVSVTFPSRRPYLYLPDGMASQDGHCRTFDAAATGTVFGDGAALVVLRRLEDALADGDEVIAVIRGYAINNDGSDKAGYAAPSIRAQTEVIRAAHLAAGVEPRSIGYVEAHGTGTPLGDPIEFAALRAAFGAGDAGSQDTGYCALGTAKTNVGHLDIAAGVTGLIKAALTLKHGEIPPLLHYERPNPNIDFASSAFFPVTQRMPWPQPDPAQPGARPGPRRAGVSAFGVGGTNIHMVLDEPPAPDTSDPNMPAPAAAPAEPETAPPTSPPTSPVVFPLSASSPEALREAVRNLGQWAEAHPQADPRAVAETLRRGRRLFGHRTVLVGTGMAGLAQAALTQPVRPVAVSRADKTAFLFPGQGAQHFGMGRSLYANAPVFREAFGLCADLLAPDLGLDLRDILYAPEAQRDAMTARLKDTALAQPAIFAMGYALAKQWAHWGVTPDVMIGHSIGEFAAATLAGVIALPDALKLIALRGRLMSGLAPGVMLSVQATEAEIQPFLGAEMDLAAVNGPRACVISGPQSAAEAVVRALDAAGFTTAPLHTSHAFHSRMMDPAVGPFRAAVAGMTLRAPTVPILSTVTGDWLTDAEATDPDYWAGQMRRPVRFLDALQLIWAEGRHLMIETGPGRTLATLATQNPDRSRLLPAIASLPHAQALDASAYQTMLESFGLLWAHGRDVDWTRLDAAGAPPVRAAYGLPGYPFQRKRFWVEPVDAGPVGSGPIGAANAETAPGEAASDAAPDPATPVRSVADALRDMFAELSGLEPAEMAGDVSFLALGFDSLLLTQATRELSDRFGVSISLRTLIDGFPTIDALAAHIETFGTRKAQARQAAKPAVAENDGGFVATSAATSATPAPVSAPITRLVRETVALTPAQQAHIDALTRRFTAKTPKSKALTAQHRPTHADPRTASGFNRAWKEIVYQIVSVRSKGSRLIDVDGNEYIDLLNGFGPGFLGHSPAPVVEALKHQIDAGFEVGPQSLQAMEAAELFCEVTGNDRASFVCTGSEAVYAAIRLARTVTARDRVVMFARDYHGNFDEVLVRAVDGKDGPRTLPLAPGIPRDSVKNVIVLPYGAPQSLDWIRANADTLAAVIVEPVQSRRPEFRPVDFVREVRRITEQSGTLFIFDEVVTGFRFGRRGAQAYYNVSADLVTYGKVVGGGMPVGVVSGKARYMDTFDGGQWAYGDDSFPQAPVTFFAGTFVRHPLAMAAVKAMLTYLRAQPEFFWHTVNTKGDRLAGGIDRWFADNDMPFAMPNCGSLMYLRIGDDQPFGALLGAHMRDRGVFLLEGFPSYMTAAHDDEDIEHALAAFKDSALEMRAGGMLAGREAVEYRGPVVHAAPPRLALPGGEARIAAAMAAPLGSIAVPATEAQRELWAAVAINPELAAAYNESVTLTMEGPVNAPVLLDAVREGLVRHDAFRATFSEDGQNMVVQATCDLAVTLLDLSGLGQTERDAALARLLRSEVDTPFNMENGPFVRAHLVVLAPEQHRLVITAHHIVCDGWSIDVVMRDIGAIYTARLAEAEPQLPPAQSIVDYARAEAEWHHSEAARQDEAYWLDQFRDPPPPLDLPTDHPRKALRSVRGARQDRVLPAPLVDRLRALARSQNASFVNLLLAAWKIYIARLADVSDITIGLPASGQAARGMPQVVGHCVNLLSIRTRIDWTAGFDSYLATVRKTLLDAYDHQNYTYGALIRALKQPRDPSRVMLVPVIFNIDNGIDLSSMSFGDTRTALTTNPRSHEHFDIYLNVTNSPDQVLTEWSYNTDLFEPATITHHIERFIALLEALSEHPTRPLQQISLLDPQTRTLLLDQWQGAVVDYPRDATLISLFLDQVAANPGAVALIEADKPVSYAALARRSVAVAQALRAGGVVAGDTVAICLDRSAGMVAAMLATMRLGAAYVPLDPSNPEARVNFIARDSRARVILTSAELKKRMGFAEAMLLEDIAQDSPDGDGNGADLPRVAMSADAMAYVAYTSGSTGQPKGVMGTHRATVNRFAWMWRAFPFQPDEMMCQKTAISFVDSVWEIFGPLLAGVPQVIIDRAAAQDPALLLAQLGRQRVTRLLLVPSLLKSMLEAGLDIPAAAPALRWLFVSGERLPGDLARRFLAQAPGITLVNLYGSSEVAADVTCEVITRVEGEEVPIGTPIDNVRLYVLDSQLQLALPGETGILYVGGDGLAAGYLHQPGLTAERFIPDPFAPQPGARMFATGDRVRYLADGRLMYEGRADQQVKIRGHRVELGEVETALAGLPGVDEVVVLMQPSDTGSGSGDARLMAFVSGHDDAIPDGAALRAALARLLPDYMLPARIVGLAQMPLNPNGKTDRQALLAMRPAQTQIDAPAPNRWPVTAAERDIHAMWVRLLDTPDIGVDDNFFELGGHSLLAVSLFSNLRRSYGVDLPISTLFGNPTIRALAAKIGDAAKAERSVAFGGAPEDSPWDTSVVIHEGPAEDTRALFIVGGVGGNVNNLYELGKQVGKSRRIIGLQTRGVLGHRMHPTIEAMAAEHIADIRRRQPEGPYLLAGYSGGAFTAYEIARQLRDVGQKVAFLGILDMYAPGFEGAKRDKQPLANRIRNELGLLFRNGPVQLFVRAEPWLRDRVMNDRTLDILSRIAPKTLRLTVLARKWWNIASAYNPGPYEADLCLLLTPPETRQEHKMMAVDPLNGWGRLVQGEVRTTILEDTDHLDMLKSRNTPALARWIEASISMALGGPQK